MTVSRGVTGTEAQGGLESVAAPEPGRVADRHPRAWPRCWWWLTHAAYTTGKYTHGYVGLVYSRMEIGVPIFFVLSGFLLFRPWVKATAAGRDCAVGAPLRLAPGAADHARLRRHRARRRTCSTTSARRGPNPGHTWIGLLRNLTPDADLHRPLPVLLSAPGPDADVEPGRRGRVLRRAAAAGMAAAGGAVPQAVASDALARRRCWCLTAVVARRG